MSRLARVTSFLPKNRAVTAVAIVLALGLLVVVFFNRLAAGNLILARGDTLLYFYPYWQAAALALREGRVPLWNASQFMGVPFMANSQVGFFYPLNWPFWLTLPTPYAASYSIMLHLLLAGLGVYMMARRCLSLARPASFLAAAMFSLGGYVTAQVEHINQVQGIAWLPWYFVVLCPWCRGGRGRRQAAKTTAGVAAVATLQVLPGHTQIVFISLLAVVLWMAVTFVIGLKSEDTGYREGKRLLRPLQRAAMYFSPFVLGVILALAMTAVQLLPTLELSRHSLRAGGLPVNEVMSFSLSPLLLGQALLPAYDQLIFSEYVLLLPVVAWLLAVIGLRFLWRRKDSWPFLIVALTSLALALGRYNPVYYLLARLPGFNLFRAPARWSVLLALVMALLVGAGWQALFGADDGEPSSFARRRNTRALVAGIMIVLAITLWSMVTAVIGEHIPAAPEAPVERPSFGTLAAWIGELMIAGAAIYMIVRANRWREPALWIIFGGIIFMLFLVTRVLPYNNPTTPEAFFDLRAPTSRLLAAAECDAGSEACEMGVGRVLSMSSIFFDVGDQPEIDLIYEKQLTDEARFDYTVAIKHKEILGPNLPLLYGIQSVDGFDGGILPLENFATLMGLLLPQGSESFDGRLREHLDAIPEERWLDLFGARYIITDKVGDVWRRDVFFDRKHPVALAKDSDPVEVGHLPEFEATELWLIAHGAAGDLTVATGDGDTWSLDPTALEADLWRVQFPRPAVAQSIALNPCKEEATGKSCPSEWQIEGMALVDERDGAFMPVLAGEYRLIHSGDVKIYENLDVLPRAFLVYDWQMIQEDEAGLALMRSETFDPGLTAIVHGEVSASPRQGSGTVLVRQDAPERIVLQVANDTRALLVLTDSFYPGWQATVDGQRADIVQVDILFRGLFLEPGQHEVEIVFNPRSYYSGRLISTIGIVAWLTLICYAYLYPLVKPSSSSR